MVILLSLATALVYGTGDFAGGLATKRTTVAQVVFGSHVVGLVGVVIASLLLGAEFRLDDLLLGTVGGLFGGLGVALLYRRLAEGPMHVVAPLTAITSAVVPSAWGLVIGESLSAIAWVGVALGLVAIGLVSSAPAADADRATVSAKVVVESLLAGVGFGTFFIFLDATDPASAPLPVVGARLVTSVLLGVALIVTGRRLVERQAVSVALIVATGLFDTLANVMFLYATAQGELAIVSVLTSLYPIATVGLARLLLGERMRPLQGVGMVGALGASALIAVG